MILFIYIIGKNDIVLINYTKRKIPKRSWDVQRQPRLFKIYNILTDEKPYRYVLENLIDNSIVAGYFGGQELTLARLKNLHADQILQRQYGANGRLWYLVSFRSESDIQYLRYAFNVR